ncbi:MAG TPA: DUF3347 domain-containing protein [Sphingobacteriaceae bacterium]|nr:DUF3347 domain-containing protein [Sphingobacteriaceae bacterium]
MKKINLNLSLALFIVGSSLFVACNQNNKKVSDTYNNPDNVAGRVPGGGTVETTEMGVDEMLQSETMVFRDTISPAFKDKFIQVVNAYLAMKDGFANDNEDEVDKQANQMMALLNNMPDNLLSGEALTYWKEKKGFLLEHLKLYKQSEKDKNKRENFVFLSTVMVKSVKALGYGNQKLYVDYCPMANNNKGAYWLSKTKEIRNPYLGSKMPDCGEVKGEI